VEDIDNELSQRNPFTAADLNGHLELDCGRYLRLLARPSFLGLVLVGHRQTAGEKALAKGLCRMDTVTVGGAGSASPPGARRTKRNRLTFLSFYVSI